jgi:hypothetical protein
MHACLCIHAYMGRHVCMYISYRAQRHGGKKSNKLLRILIRPTTFRMAVFLSLIHFLFLSIYLSLSLSLSLSVSLPVSHTLSHSHPLTQRHTHTLTHIHTRSHIFTHTLTYYSVTPLTTNSLTILSHSLNIFKYQTVTNVRGKRRRCHNLATLGACSSAPELSKSLTACSLKSSLDLSTVRVCSPGCGSWQLTLFDDLELNRLHISL